jgi:transcriptional regulator with XRE-family HTH domain
VGNRPLTDLLRKIRDNTGLSGTAAAERAQLSQAKVSRWEKGRLVPKPEDADRYARALNASAADRRRLIAMVRDLHEHHRATTPTRVSVSRLAEHEKRVFRNERDTVHIRVFHPLLLPGLLQGEEYIRAIMNSGNLPPLEVEERVATRLSRAEILNDPARRFTFVLTQGSLAWRGVSTAVMVRQIEHIADLSRRDHIQVGVIPWGVKVDVFPPCGFDLYDERTAVVGVVGGAAYYSDAVDVAKYVTMLGKLERLAVFGDDARVELSRIAGEYRGLA